MIREDLIALMEEIDAPPPNFWENELELGLDYILFRARHNNFIEDWIRKLNGRQLKILCNHWGIDGNESLNDRKNDLTSRKEELYPYYLVNQFSKSKSKVTIIDFAKGVLSPDVLNDCRIKEETFDTTALLFAIYSKDWSHLRLIFHLEKIHKTGFARMILKNTISRPTLKFYEFLLPEEIKKILVDFDKSRRDGRTSEFKDIITYDGHYLVFIRRAERPDFILREEGVMHGYRPEWIILDFEENAKRVRISSVSVNAPLEIANRIASGYFGKSCEYKNETEITYAKQIERFLKQIVNGGSIDLPLVEILIANSPLKGSHKIKITSPQSKSIGDGIDHFETAVGSILSEIENIESTKVYYCKKRVSLIFEKVEGTKDEYVVRYADHKLNASERGQFETNMREVYGIPILSTEKRYKR
jgi:hypothetical protein